MTDGRSLRLRGRIAWLLRVNRLYRAEGVWASAASFVAAFAGGSHPEAVSQSKISRWETGLIHVPYPAIRRYEQLLDLPPRSLSSTVDVVSRYMSTQGDQDATGKLWASRTQLVVGNGLDTFLDRAISTSVMTAADWDDLSTLITSAPGLRLRRREWDEISSRLLVEVVSADGDAWKPRFDAFMRLLRHPDAQQSAAGACAAWGRCRENHAAKEAVGLLDICRHPDASSAVLGQLTDPVTEDAFAGALTACVRKVEDRHFSPGQIYRVAEVSREVAFAHTDQQARIHAASVLDRLPPNLRSRMNPRRNVTTRTDPDRPGVYAELYWGTRLSGLIASRSVSLLAHEVDHFDDGVLPVLINEMIYAPLSDTRLYAAFLIRATPYRRPVSDSIIWSIKQIHEARHPNSLIRLLSALRIIGEMPHRPAVEGFTDPRMPRAVQDAAVQALGHMGGKSDAAFWRKVFSQRAAGNSTGRGETEMLMIHATYSMGMKRDLEGLRRVSSDETLPTVVRAAAEWWLDLPTHMFMSAEE